VLETLEIEDCGHLPDLLLRACSESAAIQLRSIRLATSGEARLPLSEPALMALLPKVARLVLRTVGLSRRAHTLFRSLRSLRKLDLIDVQCDQNAPESMWSALAAASCLEELTVMDCPHFPPLTDTAVQPSVLVSLRRVYVHDCPRMLSSDAMWRLLWTVPTLRWIDADLDAVAAEAAVQALVSCRAQRKLDCLRVHDLVLMKPSRAADPPSGEHCTTLLSAAPALRWFELHDTRGMNGACVAALPRPELLQSLDLGNGAAVELHTMVRYFSHCCGLRYVKLPENVATSIAPSVLEPLTLASPLLRTVAFGSIAGEGRSVQVVTPAGTVCWTRADTSSTVWARETELADRWGTAAGVRL